MSVAVKTKNDSTEIVIYVERDFLWQKYLLLLQIGP